MKVRIYPSNTIINCNISGNETITHYFMLASFISKQNISFSNISLNDESISTIKAIEKLDGIVNFYGVDSAYVTNSNEGKKEEITIDNCSIKTFKYLFPISLRFTKKVNFYINKESSIDLSYLLKECNLSIKKNNNQYTCSGSINIDLIESIDDEDILIGLIINALYSSAALTIKTTNEVVNKLKLFISIFNKCGYNISHDDSHIYVRSDSLSIWDDFVIEGDYHYGAYLIALGALNGSFSCPNLKINSFQDDYSIIDIIKSMGGAIRFINDKDTYIYSYNNSLIEKGIRKKLKGISNTNINEDLLPLLITISSYSIGKAILNKPKNRSIIEILLKLGINIIEKENELIIIGKNSYNINSEINCLNDYDISMSLIIFALLNNGNIILYNVPDECNEFIKLLKEHTKNGSITIQ